MTIAETSSMTHGFARTVGSDMRLTMMIITITRIVDRR